MNRLFPYDNIVTGIFIFIRSTIFSMGDGWDMEPGPFAPENIQYFR